MRGPAVPYNIQGRTGAHPCLFPDPSFRRKPESRKSQMKQPCVYILTSKRNGALYVGVTSSGETCMKTWLELDSGFHRNDGYAKVSAGGNLAPLGTAFVQRELGAARPFVLMLSKGERTGGGDGRAPPSPKREEMRGNERQSKIFS